MANIIIPSDERRNTEQAVRESFMVNPSNREHMEIAETIAARTKEAREDARIKGGRRYFNF